MVKTTDIKHNKGVGFLELLTLLFIGLKLGNVITWSWWWVISPLWLPIVIVLSIVLVGVVIYGLYLATKAMIEFFKK